jgi:hypothetical protein
LWWPQLRGKACLLWQRMRDGLEVGLPLKVMPVHSPS